MSTVIGLPSKQIPQRCGVYFSRDKLGRILYIGKAVNLRSRIKSYSAGQPANPRLAKLLETAAKITWQETGSEIEALILESQLIKKHRPPFNVMLRDDKQYFYASFTKEEFPKIFITHQLHPHTKRPQAALPLLANSGRSGVGASRSPQFLGPFTDGQALKVTLKLIRRIFPYCTCKQKHNNYCLNYHIGKCPGLCCLKQQSPNSQFQISNFQKEYRKNIKAIKEILSGKRATLITTLKKEMEVLARKENFEEAANLRDKIEKLEKVFENARIIYNQPNQYPNWSGQYFDKSKYQSGNEEVIAALQRFLKLDAPPHRIEGYDVANIQGKFATGAMVVFTDGKSDKNQYRKFKIKGLDPISRLRKPYGLAKSLAIPRHRKSQELAMSRNQDPRSGGDTTMLREVLTRRFNHLEWPLPNLIIVDGGKAQLNAARSIGLILRHRKSQRLAMSKIPIIALTKDEKHRGTKIFIENRKVAIPLSKLSPAVRNLILQIDAEAHRFAIGYYRKLHKTSLSS